MSGKGLLRFVFGKVNSQTATKLPSMENIEKLESRALQAEKLLEYLKIEVAELQKCVEAQKATGVNINTNQDEIRLENKKLRKEIEEWKDKLINMEKKLGIVQATVESSAKGTAVPVNMDKLQTDETAVNEITSKKKTKKSEPINQAKNDSKNTTGTEDSDSVNVGKLDIRIGKIISVKKHPDAESLYVEQVDVGEEKPRTVVSGLVKFVPIEELENRMVVLLCNLKPAKMRGVSSEAMVLCASTPEKVEVLNPPAGALPGDKVFIEGYSREPEPVLNPKKKIFETVAVNLKTDDSKTATYKGMPFYVPGKGSVTSSSLVNVNIK